MKPRVEYVYDGITDITKIFIWKGMNIVGKHMVHGKMKQSEKNEMTDNLNKKFEDD